MNCASLIYQDIFSTNIKVLYNVRTLFLFFWLCCRVCRIIVSRSGMELMPPAVEAPSQPLDHHGSPAMSELYNSMTSLPFLPVFYVLVVLYFTFTCDKLHNIL